MGLYEGIKDVAKVVQQADNIELYRRLLDLSAQALDMQEEIAKLKAENQALRKGKDIESHIFRHSQPFITLDNDDLNIPYCALCWGKEGQLLQMKVLISYGCEEVFCNNCGNRCSYEG